MLSPHRGVQDNCTGWIMSRSYSGQSVSYLQSQQLLQVLKQSLIQWYSLGSSVFRSDLANKEANYEQQVLRSYVSLMGIRQLGTGLVLTAFMLGRKWNEAATVLSVIGIVVAGTDGFYLSQHASLSKGLFHAIPGALIAALATVYITMHE